MRLDVSILVKLLRRKAAEMRSTQSAAVSLPNIERRESMRRAQVPPHKPADNHRLRSSQMD